MYVCMYVCMYVEHERVVMLTNPKHLFRDKVINTAYRMQDPLTRF